MRTKSAFRTANSGVVRKVRIMEPPTGNSSEYGDVSDLEDGGSCLELESDGSVLMLDQPSVLSTASSASSGSGSTDHADGSSDSFVSSMLSSFPTSSLSSSSSSSSSTTKTIKFLDHDEHNEPEGDPRCTTPPLISEPQQQDTGLFDMAVSGPGVDGTGLNEGNEEVGDGDGDDDGDDDAMTTSCLDLLAGK